MVWQKTFALQGRSKGVHLVTKEVEQEIREGLKDCKAGLLTLFIKHTSAALSLNENWDPSVRQDLDMILDRIVPESDDYKHLEAGEGMEDATSHAKACPMGSSITIPISNGQLLTGTWQGVYLCEFRLERHARKIVATIIP